MKRYMKLASGKVYKRVIDEDRILETVRPIKKKRFKNSLHEICEDMGVRHY